MTEINAITKVLSANDTGETGGHQAGILVPKDPEILGFFPRLPEDVKNPRIVLWFMDPEGQDWEFAFIHYNNRRFGGTRNEYRLTRMTPFLRESGLVAGDELTLTRTKAGRTISYERQRANDLADGVLKLGSGWKVVSL